MVATRRLGGSRRERRRVGLYLIEGERFVREALEIPGLVVRVFVTEQAMRENSSADLDVDAREVIVVPDRVMRAITTLTTPVGLLAVAERRCAGFSTLTSAERVIVPVGIQDAGNLGTMLRSLEAFSSKGACVVAPGTVDPWSSKVVRASAGAVGRVPLVEVDATEAGLEAVAAAGLTRVALVGSGSVRLSDLDPRVRMAILVGSEGAGLPESVLQTCEFSVAIEQVGAESLNAAVATSIALYALSEAGRARA
ncbi:MAG: TrmH family RNA methyltransferase [Ferrimicrobium sp.]